MSTEQINARDWIFEVSTDAGVTYLAIGGIKTFSNKPGDNQADTDTTTFASAGEYESQAMQRGATMDLSGQFLLDVAAHTRDVGQAACEALAALVGKASLGMFHFRHVSDTLWTVWTAWVSLSEQGGGNNDKTGWGCTLNRSGAATTASVS